MHWRPALGERNVHTCLIKSTFFILSAKATSSTSEVERVTHFCVPENQQTAAPPHITTPPEMDYLSVALLAKSASAKTSNQHHYPADMLYQNDLWASGTVQDAIKKKKCRKKEKSSEKEETAGTRRTPTGRQEGGRSPRKCPSAGDHHSFS